MATAKNATIEDNKNAVWDKTRFSVIQITMQPKSKSILNLENQEALSVTGIKKVKTAEPHQVVATMEHCTMVISGKNLSVQNISVREEILEIVGEIESIRYTTAATKKFSIRKIFG